MIEQEIDLGAVLAEVAGTSHGSQLLFVGTVRDLNEGRRVLAVSYDVLSPLAEMTIGAICAEAQADCAAPLSFAVVQRRGRVAVGQSSIAIAVGAPHRHEAYQASRYLIEAIKTRAPIWKQEHWEGGSGWGTGASDLRTIGSKP